MLTTIQGSIRNGLLPAEIAFVFCNREHGQTTETDQFLKLVESYGIPLVCLSSKKFKIQQTDSGRPDWRILYDRKVMERLGGFRPDICVLAGYMLIVGEEMCQHYNMINLHPAAPGGPTGTWREVIWKLIENDASETGVMMHLVTPELDKGPPITFCTFSIRGEPFDGYREEIKGIPVDDLIDEQGENSSLFRLIRSEGLKRELPLIEATLKTLSEGKIRILDGKVVDRAGQPIKAYSLTEEINKRLRQESPN